MRFRDRTDAGRLLADALAAYKDDDVVVYALPRGGVALGVAVAKRLHAPLDLAIPRKVGHPDHPEYAVCAITEAGHLVCTKEDAAQIDPG
jgi:putative phosphoribosyl transferase